MITIIAIKSHGLRSSSRRKLAFCFTSLSEVVFPDRSIVFDELAFSLSSSTFAPLKLSHCLHLLIIGSYLAYYRANHHRHRHQDQHRSDYDQQ